MTPPRFGAPIRLPDGRTGTYAGVVDRRHGRVRIGARLLTVRSGDIATVAAPAGDRWADLHGVGEAS